jgi:hypothetical protein
MYTYILYVYINIRRQLLFKLQESDARAKEAQNKATELENASVENKAALEKVAATKYEH